MPTTSRKPRKGRGDWRTLDIVALFQRKDLYECYLEKNIHSVHCPWEHEHSDYEEGPRKGDTIIYEPVGGEPAGFYCQHDHCDGRKMPAIAELWPDYAHDCATEYSADREEKKGKKKQSPRPFR